MLSSDHPPFLTCRGGKKKMSSIVLSSNIRQNRDLNGTYVRCQSLHCLLHSFLLSSCFLHTLWFFSFWPVPKDHTVGQYISILRSLRSSRWVWLFFQSLQCWQNLFILFAGLQPLMEMFFWCFFIKYICKTPAFVERTESRNSSLQTETEILISSLCWAQPEMRL